MSGVKQNVPSKQLIYAVEHGNIERVNELIAAGANVNYENRYDVTPLLQAVRSEYKEIVELLIAAGADVNHATDTHDITPLFEAAGSNYKDIAEVLIAAGANVNDVSSDGLTPLSEAAGNGHKDIVELLIAKGADVNHTDIYEQTPLIKAVAHKDVVELLLAAGANVNQVDANEGSPLQWAAGTGNKDVVELLLAAGAHVNHANRDGDTPLHSAVFVRNIECIAVLIDAGADANAENNEGESPFYQAVKNGYAEVVALLITAGANINHENTNGDTPLHWAAGNGNKEVVELLITAGANVNHANIRGDTPLHWAAGNGDKEIVALLLAAGANVNHANIRGDTPLHWAAGNGDKEIVKLLLASGANVNSVNANGLTVLLTAIHLQQNEIVQLLIDVPGIDITGALEYARLRNNETAIEIINDKLNPVLGLDLDPWKGWTQSDINVLNSTLDTTRNGDRSPAENVSLCPVCLKTVVRSEACMFMHHNCTEQPGYYHKTLYNLYKNEMGDIYWCTICNRISLGHRHYQPDRFDPSDPEKVDLMPTTFTGNYFGGDAECKKLGGGGWEEKVTRYRRLREYAAELNTVIGELSRTEALNKLVVEMWNAPVLHTTNAVKKIMNTRKWNIPNTSFPTAVRNNTNTNNVVEDITWPFEGRSALMPKIHLKGKNNTNWMNNISLEEDMPVLIQLVHRQADSTIKVHDERISLNTLMDAVNKTSVTGGCPIGEGCTGLQYPGELQYILDHYPIDLTDEERAGFQARIDNYKKRFNTAAKHTAAVKTQLNSNRAAARNMPAGGAGIGGRRTHTRRRHGGALNIKPSKHATPVFVEAENAMCEYPRKKTRKLRRGVKRH